VSGAWITLTIVATCSGLCGYVGGSIQTARYQDWMQQFLLRENRIMATNLRALYVLAGLQYPEEPDDEPLPPTRWERLRARWWDLPADEPTEPAQSPVDSSGDTWTPDSTPEAATEAPRPVRDPMRDTGPIVMPAPGIPTSPDMKRAHTVAPPFAPMKPPGCTCDEFGDIGPHHHGQHIDVHPPHRDLEAILAEFESVKAAAEAARARRLETR
jgi:hypothetical protein